MQCKGPRRPRTYLALHGKQPPRDRDARGRRSMFGPPGEICFSGVRGLQTWPRPAGVQVVSNSILSEGQYIRLQREHGVSPSHLCF